MRLASNVTALALLAVGTASAQPDPTDPALYAPLGVGSEWRYQRWTDLETELKGLEYVRRRVVGTVEVEGVEYAVVEQDVTLAVISAWREDGRDTLRFDADRAVVVRLEGGAEVVRSCPLDAAFGTTVTCEVGGEPAAYVVDGSAEDGQKVFEAAVVGDPFPVYEAGIGLVAIDNRVDTAETVTDRLSLYYASVVGPDGTVTEYGYEGEDGVPDVEPDPTDPARYVPLHVGFVREDYKSQGGNGAFRKRTEVLRDTTVDGRTYAVVWSARVPTAFAFEPAVPVPVEWGEGETDLLRYDALSTRVVRLADEGTEEPVVPPLGAPFGTLALLGDEPLWGEPLPDGREGDFVVSGALSVTYPIAGEAVAFRAKKSFTPVPVSFIYDGPDPRWTYLTGVGRLPPAYYFSCAPPLCGEVITYLRTRDAAGEVVEVGQPLPTDGEAVPEARPFGLGVAPTPTAGPLALVVDVPTAGIVALDAFDALGRRVWRHEAPLGAGRQRVEVDASGWASGVYVVRATVGGERVTATAVRR